MSKDRDVLAAIASELRAGRALVQQRLEQRRGYLRDDLGPLYAYARIEEGYLLPAYGELVVTLILPGRFTQIEALYAREASGLRRIAFNCTTEDLWAVWSQDQEWCLYVPTLAEALATAELLYAQAADRPGGDHDG